MNNHFQSLKIGLDYHGVINEQMHFFQIFCKVALSRGHKIYILTGGPKLHIVKKLKLAQINYTALFAIIDYYQARQQVVCPVYGHFHIDDRLWDTAKAKFCQQHQINIQIDDSDMYGKYFTTPYCQYENRLKICLLKKTNHTLKMLSIKPEEFIIEIENLFYNSFVSTPSASKSVTY